MRTRMIVEEHLPKEQAFPLDFLISYTDHDLRWAEWIAATLEHVGYRTHLAAWDVRPGENAVLARNRAITCAERTLVVFSKAYMTADERLAEWTATFVQARVGSILPIRIEDCPFTGLLRSLVCIDLVGLNEVQARERLLAGIKRDRAKPPVVAYPAPSSGAGERAIFPPSLPPIWNVPYPKNVLFTGREEVLEQLERALSRDQRIALSQPQAISGLGGIGKTQVALEYAYRHRQDYQVVFWVQAESRETLTSSYVALAGVLNLSERDCAESGQIVAAMKRWLQEQSGWLLILDNADELLLVREFLPPSLNGHVLLTTRAQAMGRFARRVEVNVLPKEVGAYFLLRRAGLLALSATFEMASEEQQGRAGVLCEELGGLPLALDQAGAYIEETGCSLAEYLRLFEHRRADLLARRGGVVEDHPHPVATTWSLSFEKVERKHPVAADLLRLCAFLAPDAIPEELLVAGGPALAFLPVDAFQLNEAVEALRAYSLVRRDSSEQLLSLHRLVQVVLQGVLEETEKRLWVERVILAIDGAFPRGEYGVCPQCERLLPQAAMVLQAVEQYQVSSEEALHMLKKVGNYLKSHARYAEAEPYFQQILKIRTLRAGPRHLATAASLTDLASLYVLSLYVWRGKEEAYEETEWASRQKKFEEAEHLHRRALLMYEQQLGSEHPKTASALEDLAFLFQVQGRYGEAEKMYRGVLSIYEQQEESQHERATALIKLAILYAEQCKYAEAEVLFQQALVIREYLLGPRHLDTATCLTNLGHLYEMQGKYVEAEPLFQQALVICEQQLGPEHFNTAISLRNLAHMYALQGRETEAEMVYRRIHPMFEQQLKREDLRMASVLWQTATKRSVCLERQREEGQNKGRTPPDE